MPYLSKIDLNPLRRGAQRLLSNPQALHAAVLGGLPHQPVTERVLWREERHPHVCSLLVLTRSEPSWEHIVEQAGWSAGAAAGLVRDLAPVLDMAVRGREFGFKVRANPVMSVKPSGREHVDGPVRGVRRPHMTAGHQLEWFLTRAREGRWGFAIGPEDAPGVQLVARERVRFARVSGRPPVTLSRATFEGRLQVTDPEVFRQTLLDGIGPAKAYGCGLLTVAAI